MATKGYFGEYAGGGALQLAAAVLAISEQSVHASAGFDDGDDEMQFDVNRRQRDVPLNHILVNSISAGGGIVCAVLSREAA